MRKLAEVLPYIGVVMFLAGLFLEDHVWPMAIPSVGHPTTYVIAAIGLAMIVIPLAVEVVQARLRPHRNP